MQLQHASAHGRQNAHISVRHALVTSRLPPACHSSNSKGHMSNVLCAPTSWSIQSCTVDPAWVRKKNRQRNQEQKRLEHWQSRPQRWGQLERKNGIDGRVAVVHAMLHAASFTHANVRAAASWRARAAATASSRARAARNAAVGATGEENPALLGNPSVDTPESAVTESVAPSEWVGVGGAVDP